MVGIFRRSKKSRAAATETRNALTESELRLAYYTRAKLVLKIARQILEYAIELDDEDMIATAQN